MNEKTEVKDGVVWSLWAPLLLLYLVSVVMLLFRLVLGKSVVLPFLPREEVIAMLFLCSVLVFGLTRIFVLTTWIPIWKLGLRGIAVAVLSLVLGGYVANLIYNFVHVNLTLMIIFCVSLFFLILPSAVDGFGAELSLKELRAFRLSSAVTISLIVTSFVVVVIGLLQERQRLKEEYINAHPLIASIEPGLVSNGSMLIIRGEGFGSWQGTDSQVVGGSGYSLQILDWKPNKIVAMIRSASTPGGLRVRKPAEYHGVVKVRESNSLSIEFYDPATASAELRRRYFNQLEQMSDEAKKLYGINSF